MAGFNIGVGVGIRYDTDIEKRLSGELIPEEFLASCFSMGYWIMEKPWKMEKRWKMQKEQQLKK